MKCSPPNLFKVENLKKPIYHLCFQPTHENRPLESLPRTSRKQNSRSAGHSPCKKRLPFKIQTSIQKCDNSSFSAPIFGGKSPQETKVFWAKKGRFLEGKRIVQYIFSMLRFLWSRWSTWNSLSLSLSLTQYTYVYYLSIFDFSSLSRRNELKYVLRFLYKFSTFINTFTTSILQDINGGV